MDGVSVNNFLERTGGERMKEKRSSLELYGTYVTL